MSEMEVKLWIGSLVFTCEKCKVQSIHLAAKRRRLTKFTDRLWSERFKCLSLEASNPSGYPVQVYLKILHGNRNLTKKFRVLFTVVVFALLPRSSTILTMLDFG